MNPPKPWIDRFVACARAAGGSAQTKIIAATGTRILRIGGHSGAGRHYQRKPGATGEGLKISGIFAAAVTAGSRLTPVADISTAEQAPDPS